MSKQPEDFDMIEGEGITIDEYEGSKQEPQRDNLVFNCSVCETHVNYQYIIDIVTHYEKHIKDLKETVTYYMHELFDDDFDMIEGEGITIEEYEGQNEQI